MKREKDYILKRLIGTLLSAMLITVLGWNVSQAAEYPDRPITIIVPFAVGGTFDVTARMLQPWLKETLGAPAVIVDNKPGGMGAIGVSAVARSKADGYTLLCNDYTATALANLAVDKPGFEWKDLIPIVTVTYDPRYFFVRKESLYKDMNDFVEDVWKRPGRVTVSIPQGSGAHWQLECVKKVMNLDIKTVGYKGGGPALTAMLGGHVDAFTSDGLTRDVLRDKLRAIAVVAPNRTELFPETPPCVEHRVFKEKGIKEIPQAPAAIAIWVHREVKENHPDIFNKLVAALFKVKEHPGFLEKARTINMDKISVWYGTQKSLEMKDQIMKAFQEYPEIVKMMKE